jgi:hypothetical protein
MQDITANLYDCAHCSKTGTCTSGDEGRSCSACIKHNELKGALHRGLACGTCGGLGKGEPMTEKMNKRIQPMLAIYLVVIAFVVLLISLVLQSPHFSEVLAFVSTLVGGVAGFYFSQRGLQARH